MILTRRLALLAVAALIPGAAQARKRRGNRIDALAREQAALADSQPKLVKTIRIVGEPPPYAPAGHAGEQFRWRSFDDIYDGVPPFNGKR